MPVARNEVGHDDRWNLGRLYPSLDAWKKELKVAVGASSN